MRPTGSVAIPRRAFIGLSFGAALTLSPLGTLIARALPQPVYKLPVPGEFTVRVIQGINSGRTHVGRSAFAWDFRMPEGSPMTAARAGRVWMMKQDSDSGCPQLRDLNCPELNNYIVLDHGDGTSSLYLHGVHDGARVRLGQFVEQGDMIGLSGNTGQSFGPHLHFQVQHNNGGQYVSQSFQIAFEGVPDKDGVPITRGEYKSSNKRVGDFDLRDGHFFAQA